MAWADADDESAPEMSFSSIPLSELSTPPVLRLLHARHPVPGGSGLSDGNSPEFFGLLAGKGAGLMDRPVVLPILKGRYP